MRGFLAAKAFGGKWCIATKIKNKNMCLSFGTEK